MLHDNECLLSRLPGTVSGFGLDYLPAAASSATSENSWHQGGGPSSSWAAQETPMEDSSAVLLDSLKVLNPPPPPTTTKNVKMGDLPHAIFTCPSVLLVIFFFSPVLLP